MPADRIINDPGFCLDFLASKGKLLKCTICRSELRKDNTEGWKTIRNMKRHVGTDTHQTALTRARIRSLSNDTRPPLPPPCPTPWAEALEPAYSSFRPNVSHSNSGSGCGSDSGSDSDSNSNSGSQISALSANTHVRPRKTGSGKDIDHVLSVVDDIDLEKDPNLDEIGNETEEGFLASILNEDVLRGFREVPAWEPDDVAKVNTPPPNPATYPWPDRAHHLTHMLFSSPEHRFSRSQQGAILQWAVSCGMEHVPTLYSLDKCAQLLKECTGDPTRKFTSSLGNVYFMNSVSSALQQDMSNPGVRASMQFYPTDGEGEVSEIWDGEKLSHGLAPEQLTPMVAVGNSHYFVNEFCELDGGTLFIPEMFLRRQGGIWARGYDVKGSHVDGLICLSVSEVRVLRPVSSFRNNCVDICGENMGLFKYSADSTKYQDFLPHPLRQKAQGRSVYSIPFIVFQDDVSGNRTKQFNKHNVCYMTNAALPRTEYNKTPNIRFVGSSTTCAPLEMIEGLTTMFKETFEEPVLAFDAATKSEVLVRAYIVLISADNPMHAEHCSSTGLQSNFPCRVCRFGGTQVTRKTEDGLAKAVEPGMIRDPQDTVAAIRSQYDGAFTHMAESYLTNAQRAVGIKDCIAQPTLKWIQTRGKELLEMSRPDGSKLDMSQLEKILRAEMERQGRQMHINPLLELPGFNVHLDTPIEILHTVLLGAVKYFWRLTCKLLDDTSKADIFRIRFNSLSLSGLEMGTQLVPEYICRYRGSLTGRHFRFVVQLIAFAAYDLIPTEVLRVFLSLGRLTVLLWYTSIPNMDSYTAELSDTISDFLHSVAIVDPRTLIQKTKLHILAHAPLFARRFGPLLGPNSERYESFNSVFRMCSVLSNRSAPSLDTATQMARMDAVRHVATGGWWFNSATQRFCHAGPAILGHFKHHPNDYALLGLSFNLPAVPGFMKIHAKPKHFKLKTWAEALEVYAPCPSIILENDLLSSAESIVARNRNSISKGSDIIYSDGERLSIGRVVRIAAIIGPGNTSFVIVNPFDWHREVDSLLQMPSITRLDTFKVVNGQDIQCHINLQHRCWNIGCDTTALKTIRQERLDTLLTQAATNHKDTVNYVVNIHSMTNAIFIRDLIYSNGVPLSLFFPKASREQARRVGVQLLHAREVEKSQKKANAAERLLASEAPENAPNNPTARTKSRTGRSGGGHGQVMARAHTSGTSHASSSQHQATMHEPIMAGTSNNEQRNRPNAVQAVNQPYAPLLPAGWEAAWSPTDRKYYYFNRERNMSTWEYPE